MSMDYTSLLNDVSGKISKVGVVGATKGYGYTLLAQIPHVKHMSLRVICSRHTDECYDVLAEIGYDTNKVVICNSAEEIAAAGEDAIIIVADYRLVAECGITAMVECTGNVAVSSDAAIICMKKGINVYMCSKETDSVCGPILNQIAKECGVVYALVNGDQPRNLIDLYSWVNLLGLEVVCVGKSSEYDFVWDRETGEMQYTDGSSESTMIPEFINCWRYQGAETLKERRRLVEKYTSVISADLCEMNLVSNVTGFPPSAPFLSYPVAKASELANIFCPVEDGGVLTKKGGVVDVFYNLRGVDEASFAGGEFVVIKCENEKMWEILAGKGHVMSTNGKYCCIYYPYHFMGMETPASLLVGDFMGIGNHPETRQVSIMAGVAEKDLPAGTKLIVAGHHHSIDGLVPELLERKEAATAAPFYLLNGAVLLNEVKKGNPVTTNDVDLQAHPAYELFKKGLEL